LSSFITLNDVTLRDGLQNEPYFVPTEDKVALANLILDSNIKSMELTSFVNPKAVPQLSDNLELSSSEDLKDGYFSALVPNPKGYERALKSTKIKEIVLFVSACEKHNLKNVSKSIDDSLNNFLEIFRQNTRFVIKPSISMVFGSPFTGGFPEERVLFKIIQFFIKMGVKEITLSDTWGAVDYKNFEKQLKSILKNFDSLLFSLHLHSIGASISDKLRSSLDNGIAKFDTAFMDLGGCPFSPEKGGNLNIREIIKISYSKGYKTGIEAENIENIEQFILNMKKEELKKEPA